MGAKLHEVAGEDEGAPSDVWVGAIVVAVLVKLHAEQQQQGVGVVLIEGRQ